MEAQEAPRIGRESVAESEADLKLYYESNDKRKSYSRETKLAAIQEYHESRNKYQTAKKVGVNPSTLRGWIQNEDKIQSSSRGSRKVGCGRAPFWPDMEDELHRQYRKVVEKRQKVKSYWFETMSKKLMAEMHPEVEFKFSDGWFNAFKRRKGISCHSTDNTNQKSPVYSSDKLIFY